MTTQLFDLQRMSNSETSVSVTRLVSRNDGMCTFEDVAVGLKSGDPDDPPLAKSSVTPATAICFRWTPGNRDFDLRQMPQWYVVIPLQGELEIIDSSGACRLLTIGDVLELRGTFNNAVVGRAVNGALRTAVIHLDDSTFAMKSEPIAQSPDPGGVDYLRTFDAPDGKSDTTAGCLPYCHRRPTGCLVTEEIPILGFQFVLAPPDLNYSWHRAPQRQFVIPMTGGMEVENGRGGRNKVLPGEIYVGEDVDGHGHITRAIDGCERLSIFAHLKGSLT